MDDGIAPHHIWLPWITRGRGLYINFAEILSPLFKLNIDLCETKSTNAGIRVKARDCQLLRQRKRRPYIVLS